MGAQKSIGGSTFVGMTRNTGHRYCAELIWQASRDFVTPKPGSSKLFNHSHCKVYFKHFIRIRHTWVMLNKLCKMRLEMRLDDTLARDSFGFQSKKNNVYKNYKIITETVYCEKINYDNKRFIFS